jgi:hypothetical protein
MLPRQDQRGSRPSQLGKNVGPCFIDLHVGDGEPTMHGPTGTRGSFAVDSATPSHAHFLRGGATEAEQVEFKTAEKDFPVPRGRL